MVKGGEAYHRVILTRCIIRNYGHKTGRESSKEIFDKRYVTEQESLMAVLSHSHTPLNKIKYARDTSTLQ